MRDRTCETASGGLSPEGDDAAGAVFGGDGTYRYRLWRTWDPARARVAFVMCNPSTADAHADDPTCRRCIGYAKQWGYGSLEIGNLFSLRATSPARLEEHPDPVGPETDAHLREICENADLVVAAWGAAGALHGRGEAVARLLDAELYALGTTRDGWPVHPLYQPADAELEPWRVECVSVDGVE